MAMINDYILEEYYKALKQEENSAGFDTFIRWKDGVENNKGLDVSWKMLVEDIEEQFPLLCTIEKKTEYGFWADYHGLKAFVPQSVFNEFDLVVFLEGFFPASVEVIDYERKVLIINPLSDYSDGYKCLEEVVGIVTDLTDEYVKVKINDTSESFGVISKKALSYRCVNPMDCLWTGDEIKALVVAYRKDLGAYELNVRSLYPSPKVVGVGISNKDNIQNLAFVIDTNVFINNPDIIQNALQYGEVFIPAKVVEELDNLKIRKDVNLQQNAKKALSIINRYNQHISDSEKDKIHSRLERDVFEELGLDSLSFAEFRSVAHHGSVQDALQDVFADANLKVNKKMKELGIEDSHVHLRNASLHKLPYEYRKPTGDNFILAVAKEIQLDTHYDVVLLTSDNGLQAKALSLGINNVGLSEFYEYKIVYQDYYSTEEAQKYKGI